MVGGRERGRYRGRERGGGQLERVRERERERRYKDVLPLSIYFLNLTNRII